MTHPLPTRDQAFALRDGMTIGLAEYGDPNGHPVLSMHGTPASRLMFDVAASDARHHGLRLICPDRPGYGLTPADRDGTLEGWIEELERLADALRLERFAILGVSGGSPYAVALAAQLGNRISALTLVSPIGPVSECIAAGGSDGVKVSSMHRHLFIDLPKHRFTLWLNAEAAAVAFHAAPSGTVSAFAYSLGNPDKQILSRPHVKESLIRMTQESIRTGIKGPIKDVQIFGHDWNIDYASITAPATLWQGTADHVVPQAAAYYLAASIPGCQLERIEGAGHFWIYDNIPEVLSRLRWQVGTT